jgi:hypothetical protein
VKKSKPEMTEAEEQELRDNPVNNFICQECKCAQPLPFLEFKEHLMSVHNINADQIKGKKQMLMHIDGAQWYSYTYQWEIEPGLKFQQYIEMARSKDDPMRFEY